MPVGLTTGGTSMRGTPYEAKAKKAIFLTSTVSMGHSEKLAETLQNEGAKLGSGMSALLDMGFKEDTPLSKCLVSGLTGIVTDDSLRLRRDTADQEWPKLWEQFASSTQLGVLVLAGAVQGFQQWAARV